MAKTIARAKPEQRNTRNKTNGVNTQSKSVSERANQRKTANSRQQFRSQRSRMQKRQKQSSSPARDSLMNAEYEYSSVSENEESIATEDVFSWSAPPQHERALLEKRTPTCKIEKPAHRMQYAFNNRITKKIELALLSLVSKPIDAQTALLQAKEEIAYRQKIIRIADQNGWDTVREYEATGIGEDEADEKRIRKAAELAAKKRGAAPDFQWRKRRQSELPFPREGSAVPSQIQPLFSSRPQQLFHRAPLFENRRIESRNAAAGLGNKLPVKIRKLQSYCYTCGVAGHWAGDPQCKGSSFRGYF